MCVTLPGCFTFKLLTRAFQKRRHMRTRDSIPSLTLVVVAIVLSGCGGGGGGGLSGGSSGGNGGGSGGSSISLLSPSSMMTGIPLGTVNVFGTGFTRQSEVLLDGVSVPLTLFVDSGTLQAQIPNSLWTAVGVHHFSVQSGGSVTNALPFTVYTPQSGPQVMEAMPGFLVGDFAADPGFIVAADVNGDGLSDVIMQGPAIANSAGSIAIFDGQADGSLSPVQYLPTTNTPYSLAAGDVNGDGNTDLVFFVNINGSTLLNTWQGDGHGNFQQAFSQPITTTTPIVSPAYLADLDGDGKPDLVVAFGTSSTGVNNLVWFQNTGGGNFAAPVTLATVALDLANFSIADFNNDGRPDILYTVPGSPESFHILMNQGGGQFKDQVATGLNGIVGAVNVLDFNLDGIPDLVVQVPTGNVTMYSFVGHGNGSFTQAGSVSFGSLGFRVYTLVAGDFDHDGFPDLAGINGETEPSHMFYLFGDGHGNFTPQQVVGPMGVSVAVGDFNGDGIPDLIVPDRFNFVSLALGRTDRNFPSALSLSPATAIGVATGDVNGDGLPEILIGGDIIHGVPGTLFLNQGNNSFTFAASTDPGSFSLADFTGKGVVDLIAGKGPNLVIWPNNGSLDFSTSTPVTVPQQPVNGPISVADIDGDGHADVGALGEILYGNGMYQFTAVPTQNSFFEYVVGDFNGDGKLDIVTDTFTYLNTGNRTFQQITGNLPLINGAMAVVGDFNGDGKDDVAINLPGDMAIFIYYGQGDGTFYSAAVVDPGQYPGAMAVGDFNGDGRLDLAVGLEFSHQVCVFFNNGNGQFTRSFFASGADTVSMVATDLNGDGKPDLAITNFMLGFRPPNADVIFHK